MSAVHHYTIRCDHEGCTHTFTDMSRTAAECRRAASSWGWSQRVVRKTPTRHAADDICPVHGDRLANFTPPAEMPVPCSCDARGAPPPCYAHLPHAEWRDLAAGLAMRLIQAGQPIVVSGEKAPHARLVLQALGYQPG